MITIYLVTLGGVALAQASPGPNFLAVVGAALGRGRRAALLTVSGVASGMLIWAAMTALGLAALLAVYPAVLTALKLVGGAYLVFLALSSARNLLRRSDVKVAAVSAGGSSFTDWRRGLLVVITNPKAALMWSAVGVFLFGSGLSAWQVVLFGPIAAVSASVIYGSYGLLFSTGVVTRWYQRFSRWIEGAFSVMFGTLGASLLWSGLREAGAK